MNRPRWESSKHLWHADGSLRDLYIRETSLADWRRLMEVVAGYKCEYLFDGRPSPLPKVEEIFKNRDRTHLLRIHVGSVTVNSHFFVPEEIELDIDPREIRGPQEHAEVLMFLENVAHKLNKPIILAPENTPDRPYVSYQPSQKVWTQ